MSVLLALVAAASYGVSDFLGGLLSRRASTWAIAAIAQIVALLVAIPAALVTGGQPPMSALAWGALAGTGSGAGTFFLYRGLAGGQMNVTAPVSAVGAAVLPAVAGLALGERPGTLATLGILCALPAIWLVSSSDADATASPTSARGLRDGLAAGVAFGLLFLALGQVGDDAGLWPLVVAQVVAVAVLLVGAAMAGAGVRAVPAAARRGAVLVGLTAGLAGLAYQVAVQGALVSVTAVLTSLYPAGTVVLAIVFLHERIHRLQAVGLVLAAGSVVLVALP